MVCATCGCVYCYDGDYYPWFTVPLPADCEICRCEKRGKACYPDLAAAAAVHADRCLTNARYVPGYAYPCSGDHWHLSRSYGTGSVRLEGAPHPPERWQEQLAALKEAL